MMFQRQLESPRSELAAAIGVDHAPSHPGNPATTGHSVIERRHSQAGLHPGIDGVPDDPVAVDVFDRAEVELPLTRAMFRWDRPDEALDRSVPGHWEGDLIIGKNGHSAIGTVVERHSNYLLLVHLEPTKNRVEGLSDGLVSKLAELPEALKRSLTWDQGTEMYAHQRIAQMAGIDIFFADPHSPWQRATNENTNGLLRQYFPKGTDLSVHSQIDLDHVADQMNRRPRRRLEFATPYEVLSDHLLR